MKSSACLDIDCLDGVVARGLLQTAGPLGIDRHMIDPALHSGQWIAGLESQGGALWLNERPKTRNAASAIVRIIELSSRARDSSSS
jgi:hypothetical protein